MGSPKSGQLPALIEFGLPLQDFTSELDLDIRFHIVVARCTDYSPSTDFLKKMLPVAEDFEMTVWHNLSSFRKFAELSVELGHNCKMMDLPLRQFGDFEVGSYLSAQILAGTWQGFALIMKYVFYCAAVLSHNFSLSESAMAIKLIV